MPIQVVHFVIAVQGNDGNTANHVFTGIEPGIPLVIGLPVVDEVADIDEKTGILIAFPSRHGRITPNAVVGRLGVRENESLEIGSVCRFQRQPAAPFVRIADPVFVVRAGVRPLMAALWI